MSTSGYLTEEELRTLVYSDIRESGEMLRGRLERKRVYKDTQLTHA